MPVAPITEKMYSLEEKFDATPEVLIVRFKPEDGSANTFEPGMFMMISGVDSAGKKYIGRAFSISSDPSSPGMEFMIIKQHMKGDQLNKSHFMDAQIGDKFMLKGPNGQFKFDPNLDKKVFFIAGGTGLAPFMSMLRHVKLANSGNDIIMLYSVKFPTEVIMKDELDNLANSLKAKLVVTVTRPPADGSYTGQTGHIDAAMVTKYCSDIKERTFYICGPLPFVQAVKQALASLSIPDQRVKADVWG